MSKMNTIELIELAEEFGAEYHRSSTEVNPIIFHRPEDLEAFAQAVIADYVAGLVPVAWTYTGTDTLYSTFVTLDRNKAEIFALGSSDVTPLYALPLGETK